MSLHAWAHISRFCSSGMRLSTSASSAGVILRPAAPCRISITRDCHPSINISNTKGFLVESHYIQKSCLLLPLMAYFRTLFLCTH